ncbi:MAG: hypothetical protein P4M09_29865 [Devosia sp.]|nr:hypothetical protein [Devosia sp.]
MKSLFVMTGLMLATALPAYAEPSQAQPVRIMPVPTDAPSVTIGNGLITAKIYRIDPIRGFYRGQRFDQAGVVGVLSLGNQHFYGPWFDLVSSVDLDNPDRPEGLVVGANSAISGPVEEFAPAGYDAAAPGGSFLKIGVGRLRRPDAKDYDHARDYALVDGGKRDTITTASSITFTQDVAGGYHYVKTLRLVPGKPQLRIEHVLTNTGTVPINTNVYDHNFLNLGRGNGDVAVTFPFVITPDLTPDPRLAQVKGNGFAFVRPLTGDERVAFLISGFGPSARDYDVTVRNVKTGVAVRVTGDDRLVRLYTWSIRTVMAVEPFVGIDLAPGATKRWAYTYTYSGPAARDSSAATTK